MILGPDSCHKWFKPTDPIDEVSYPDLGYVVKHYKYPTKPGCWDFTRAEVYRDDVCLVEVRRNYSRFWDCLFRRPDGDWFLCGTTYLGQTAVRLDTREFADYQGQAWSFCISSVEWGPDNPNELRYEGCAWGGPFMSGEFDISEPLRLPWPVESRRSEEVPLDLEEDDE